MSWVPDPTTTANFIADVAAARGYVAVARHHLVAARTLTTGLAAATKWASPAMVAFEHDLDAWLRDLALREEAIEAFDQQLEAANTRLVQRGWPG
ncbi:hypothetical protein LQ938_14895 [Microbacterium sp. cx-55]|uniref:hypothetical protein n=1 Tax=unclassified Microbacterium TaxID=2609290 RepID=UPI001CBD05E1|nr:MULTISPECIES: hypothetical protein [unclassified Microbacterium]MBZ4488482.1 hypothetical protein [Microbacterium sp. cx-55]MCC4909449.1 hypothetical protein [Microbacterium sp. cx-59]UGB35124.1 hypothetical protein LQ938_14895 [Microbacterium sp. cx-55]